mmetsp:Transcript_12502/g.48730  ORF Transcript_12502/g.48730 Transcript_12502/m.48730 type:complete len:290 (+) Transcript_12502:988-1857(+)
MGRLLPLPGLVAVVVVVLLVVVLLLDLLLELPRARRPAPRLLHGPARHRRVPSHHRDALLASLRGGRDGRRQLSVDHLQVRSRRHQPRVGRLQLLQLLEEELLRLVQTRQVRAVVGVVHGIGRHPDGGVSGVTHRRGRRRGLHRVISVTRRLSRSSNRIVFAHPRLAPRALAVPGLSVRGLGAGVPFVPGVPFVAKVEELVPVVVMRVVVMIVVVALVVVPLVVVPTRRLRPHVVVHSLRVLHARLDREQLLLRVLHLAHRALPSTPELVDLHRVRPHRSLQRVEVGGR